jgi:hypothetical protein
MASPSRGEGKIKARTFGDRYSFNGITSGIAQAGKPMLSFDCTLVLIVKFIIRDI